MAVCVLAVGLVYSARVFHVPHAWMYGAYDLALRNICYVLLGLFFLIYAAHVAAFRWTTILVGAAFGYLAGVFGQHLAMMAFEPQRWIHVFTHHGWRSASQGIVSTLLVPIVLGIWLGGAIAGAIIFSLDYGLAVLKAHRRARVP